MSVMPVLEDIPPDESLSSGCIKDNDETALNFSTIAKCSAAKKYEFTVLKNTVAIKLLC